MLTVGIIEKGYEIINLIKSFISENVCEVKKIDYSDELMEYDIIIDDLGKCPENVKSYIYILNSDEKPPEGIMKPSFLISYGLNSLATVTASSISAEGNLLCFQYCLQREIADFKGNKIEPQEIPFVFQKEISIHSALVCVTFAAIVGGNGSDSFKLML